MLNKIVYLNCIEFYYLCACVCFFLWFLFVLWFFLFIGSKAASDRSGKQTVFQSHQTNDSFRATKQAVLFRATKEMALIYQSHQTNGSFQSHQTIGYFQNSQQTVLSRATKYVKEITELLLM